jgi:hypothetical protein
VTAAPRASTAPTATLHRGERVDHRRQRLHQREQLRLADLVRVEPRQRGGGLPDGRRDFQGPRRLFDLDGHIGVDRRHGRRGRQRGEIHDSE